MSKIRKNKICINSKVRKGLSTNEVQVPFGSRICITTNVYLAPKLFYAGDHCYNFDCSLTNEREEKMICNYAFELVIHPVNIKPINVISKSREEVAFKKIIVNKLGLDKVCLDYFRNEDFNLSITFRFELEEILTPDVKPVTPNNSLMDQIFCLYKDDNFKDLSFKIGDEEVMAHRIVLAARSKVFHAMLQHDTKERREGVIEIKDSDVDSFKAFLKYCYTNEFEGVKNNAVNLLILAEKYNVECLKSKCEDYLRGITDKENAISHLIAAYLSNSALLKATALFKIKPCVEEILKSQDARLLNDYPQLFREIMLIFDS